MTFVRRARRRRLFLAAVLGAIAAFPATTFPVTPAGAAPNTQPPAAYIVVDADTGKVLAAQNEHEPHLTASTIKVFTALVALEHRPVDAPVLVSNLAAGQPASKIDMKEGSTWTLDQALHSLLIISANDAAYAIAESTGGDLAGFERMANATAKRLGMRRHQLPRPGRTRRRRGLRGRHPIEHVRPRHRGPQRVDVSPPLPIPPRRLTYEFTDPSGAGRRLVNHNRGFLTTYPGAIGFKTGYTKQAGRTLITAARRDGRTLIAVVMNTWDDTGWSGFLLDQAFAGTGPAPTASPAQLPPVRTVPYDARTAQFSAVPAAFAAALSSVGLALPAPSPTLAASTPASTAPTTTPTTAPPTEADVTPAAVGSSAAGVPTTVATSTTDGWSWGTFARTVGLVLLGLLIVVVILRRRAVKRQRARRIERLKAHREARRRGMIDIIEADDTDMPRGPGGHQPPRLGEPPSSERAPYPASRTTPRPGVPPRSEPLT